MVELVMIEHSIPGERVLKTHTGFASKPPFGSSTLRISSLSSGTVYDFGHNTASASSFPVCSGIPMMAPPDCQRSKGNLPAPRSATSVLRPGHVARIGRGFEPNSNVLRQVRMMQCGTGSGV